MKISLRSFLFWVLAFLLFSPFSFGQSGDPLPNFGGGGPLVTAAAPVNGTTEVQTVTFGGTPTGGTFTLIFEGRTTTAITWSSTNSTLIANMQTALRALPTIGSTGVTVGAGSLSSGIGGATVTFGGNLVVLNVPQMTVGNNSLTGSSPTVAVTTTTAGVTADGRTAKTGQLLICNTTGYLYSNQSATLLQPNWVQASAYRSVQTATPTTGQTVAVNFSPSETAVILTPAGTLSALTVTFPATPVDGERIQIFTTQIVSTATMPTFTGTALSAFAANTAYSFIYSGANSAWYRLN